MGSVLVLECPDARAAGNQDLDSNPGTYDTSAVVVLINQ